MAGKKIEAWEAEVDNGSATPTPPKKPTPTPTPPPAPKPKAKPKQKTYPVGQTEDDMSINMKSGGCAKMAKGGSIKKLFGGKESYGEELKEAKSLKSGKISPKQFVKGEKSEGHKDEENPSLIAKEIKKGSMSPKQYASVESKEKKYARGGGIEVRGKTRGRMC